MKKNAKKVLLVLVLSVTLAVGGAFGQTTAEAVVTFTCARVILGTNFQFTKSYTVNAANESEATRKARVEYDKEASQAITVWNLLSTSSVRWKDPKAAAEMFGKSGRTHYDNRRYDSAIADYTEAIRLNPNNVVFYYNRGDMYNNKRNYTQARADVNRALQINPNYQNAKDLDAFLKWLGY